MGIITASDVNTVILLLILMLMFGEYSQRYYKKANWGLKWKVFKIAPLIYYISGAMAILLIAVLVVIGVLTLVYMLGGN